MYIDQTVASVLQDGRHVPLHCPGFPCRDNPDRTLDGDYADDVMHLFKDEFRKRSAVITEYEAKIFGGWQYDA